MKKTLIGLFLILSQISRPLFALNEVKNPISDISINAIQLPLTLPTDLNLNQNQDEIPPLLQINSIGAETIDAGQSSLISPNSIPRILLKGSIQGLKKTQTSGVLNQSLKKENFSGLSVSKNILTPNKKQGKRKNSIQRQLIQIARETPDDIARNFDEPFSISKTSTRIPVPQNLRRPKIGRLGKKEALHDARTLAFQNYLSPKIPAAPVRVNFASKVKKWGMMLNATLGDCAIAAAGHQIKQWTANAGQELAISNRAILKAYRAVSGYSPNKPHSDIGSTALEVLRYWRKVGIADHKIAAFAALELGNLDHIRKAVWIFGGAYLGIQLPISAQKQAIWSVPAGGPIGKGKPGSWGGHAVQIAGYGPKGVLVVTWGELKWMTWDFLKVYCDEAYAIISEDFLVGKTKTPNNGFDIATLKADLKAIKSKPTTSSKRRRKSPLLSKSENASNSLDGLSLKDLSKPERIRLQEIIAIAKTTPTGYLILEKMRALTRNHDAQPIIFASLGKELGEYDYTTGILKLDHRFLKGDSRLAAATLVHELVHITQHAQDIPAEALEMELEAYALHLKTLKELHVPKREWDSFSRLAFKQLKRGPPNYIRLMERQHPGKFLLKKSEIEELVDSQEDELERQKNIIDAIKKNGSKRSELKARLRKAQTLSDWTQRDIDLLQSKEGLRRYTTFSAEIHSLVRHLSRSL